MSEQEARDEAERRYPSHVGLSAAIEDFVAGARWERARPVPVEVTDEMVEQAAKAVDRIFGWMHLRRYASPSVAWMDKLRDAIARAALSAALGGGE